MNEVSDSLLEQEKAAARVVSQGTFKVAVPVAKLSAESLAMSIKTVLGLTKGLKDMGIDAVNMVRTASGKSSTSTKHRHIVGSGSSYKNIQKTAKKKGDSLDSVEVSDKTMLGFETIARQYGIDYGLKKNEATSPPTWQVYFMAKDRATMANAFRDFTNRQLAAKKETPIEQFKRVISRMADHVKPEKIMRQTGHQR
jgi:hypothetical protein